MDVRGRLIRASADGSAQRRGAVRLAWIAPGFEAVRFRITDLQGPLVVVVPAGHGGGGVLAAWDGRDATGQISAPGLYLARAETAAGPVPGLAPARILRLR